MAVDDALTERIIGCAFHVANELGPGFLEKVYENAFAYELRKAGLKVVQQQGIEVHYDGRRGGLALPGHHVGEHEGGRRASEARGRSPLVHGRVVGEFKLISSWKGP